MAQLQTKCMVACSLMTAVVKDATAGAKIPDGDVYLASRINFRMLANAVWTPDEAVEMMRAAK